MPRKFWAAYVSTPRYGVNGITLHATHLEAARHVWKYLTTGTGDPPLPDAATAEDVVEEITALVDARDGGDEWYLCEVDEP